MALSLADKLRQAAAVRMAQTAGETTARLDDMDAKAGMQTLPPKGSPKPHAATPAADAQTEHDNRAGQASSQTEQDKRAQQPSRTNGQAAPLTLLLPAAAPARTAAQKTLLAYFARHGSHVSNYDGIIAETGLPLATVRRTVNKFVSLGILAKSSWRSGSLRGLQFTFFGATEQDNRAPQSSRIPPQDNPAGLPDASLFSPERKALSLSPETLTTCWPTLAKAGFGLEQLRQIERTLRDQGKDIGRVFQGLDHAEYELERGQMRDKDKQPVADPCSRVCAVLARTGYYRRPRGYVSPEEQAAKDAETEAKAVVATRQAAEQAQFETWRDGLSAEELSAVMRGHPGGSQEAWLKKMWRERFRADVASQACPVATRPGG